ncbi:glucose-6-phosphate 1-epimerase [Hysterangium stoloniferum]|nr:glucose-6-phosphate 1-epimerase [Hysterangium stoloniferum]
MPLKVTDSKVTLIHPNGSSAEILFYGATVISWKAPSKLDGGPPVERLYTSPKAFLDGSKPVRGGIPVVFPFFGPSTRPEHSQLAQHGFARSEVWQFDSTVMDNEAGVSVRFVLEPTAAIKAKFPAAFTLSYVVTLAAHQLTTHLHVTNPSQTNNFTFQALLHTYIKANIALSTVTPLKGLTYINKLKPGFPEETEEREAVDVREPADFVYKAACGEYEVSWGGGLGIEIKATGFKDVVIWNPGKDGRKMSDLEEGGWDLFVCVEPGAASYWIDLGPGESWDGQQVLTVI